MNFGRFQLFIAMWILLQKQVNSLRRRHYLTRKSLTVTYSSAWRALLNEKNDLSFINTTGLNYRAFMQLWHLFKFRLPLLQCKAGRRRQTKTKDVLGLVLYWLNSNCKQKTLCQVFGLVPSAVSNYLWMGMEALEITLKNIKLIQVRWPTELEMEDCAKLVRNREPLLPHSFGFVDGLNLPVLESSDAEIQNAYYNGWLAGCFVSNVFVFNSKGIIIYAAINKPGSWHDSNVARSLYDKLRYNTPGEYNILADSAFSFSEDLAKNICAVMKDSAKERLGNSDAYREAVRLDNAVIGQRQAAEWGMGSIQRTFGRLKSPLPVDNLKRKLILKVIVLLYNYRVKFVGLNQIQTVFGSGF